MNLKAILLRAGLALAVSSSLVIVACQKKETTADAAKTPPPAPAKSESEVQKAADTMAKAASEMKKEADAMVATAQKEAADKVAKVEDAAAKMKADMQAKADEAMAAQKKAEADAAKAKADAEAAKAAAADKIASIQKEAADLLAKYTAEIDVLKNGAVAVKKIIDQNASLLPEGVQAKYKELDALLPQVTSLVSSLKGYQGTDLNSIVSKIQTDLGSAQKLYGEIRGMLPANLNAMLPKL